MSGDDADRADRAEALHRVTDVLRCKWAVGVMDAISRGVHRPSLIQRELPGLSNKVLAERLQRLHDYGVVDRTAFDETPPRVEYTLTPRGEQLRELVNTVTRFAEDWAEHAGAGESSIR